MQVKYHSSKVVKVYFNFITFTYCKKQLLQSNLMSMGIICAVYTFLNKYRAKIKLYITYKQKYLMKIFNIIYWCFANRERTILLIDRQLI